jgi:hypothetical protein
MLKDSLNLLSCDTGEPLEKVISGRPISEILEQRGNRNPSATKNPSSAHPVRRTFNS